MPNRSATEGGPYAHKKTSVQRTMVLVMVALVPATAYDLYLFGWPAINLFVITIASALMIEALCLVIARKPIVMFLTDGSAILTAWLLAMSLPPWAPWWIGVLGAGIAIVIGKQIFGGIGQNVFNPAMVARVALLISFPLEMTTFVAPSPLGTAGAPGFMDSLAFTFGLANSVDVVSSASVLGHVKTELSRGIPLQQALEGNYDLFAMTLGDASGSMGETSFSLILVGGLFLIIKRVISWHIPVAMLGTIAIMATLFNLINPAQYPDALFHLVSGATVLGAFFIATDLVTSPVTKRGQLLFGVGCGLLVYIIRTWTAYPEGMAFAVLLMNAMTPLIDRYIKPRVYGRTIKGDPLAPKGGS
ncbi:MAG: RnfABCDGE type electron transport complex subunit D [Alphaproteobacteria bacterium]|nr:RnfABCDGE type electron transport complex subunit D [Rhodospirillales bacterium]MCW9046373.1 RnfABCDGE type electron transport complex subunit D [Alphaproteobacteria bacterium]